MLVTIEKQSKEISQWEHRYNQMKTKYEKLEREVAKLKQANKNNNISSSIKQEVINHRHNLNEEHKYTRSQEDPRNEDSFVGSVIINPGSAVSTKPLPKVLLMKTETTKKSPLLNPQKKNNVKALLKVVMLCLLCKNSSMESTSNSILKSLQKALSPKSTQQWKLILQQAIDQMPKKKAPNASCLDQWWTSQCLGPENREWNPPKILLEAHWNYAPMQSDNTMHWSNNKSSLKFLVRHTAWIKYFMMTKYRSWRTSV